MSDSTHQTSGQNFLFVSIALWHVVWLGQGPKREEALSLLQIKADLWHSQLNAILEARSVVSGARPCVADVVLACLVDKHGKGKGRERSVAA